MTSCGKRSDADASRRKARQVFWSVPLKPSYGMSITTPRQLGPYLLATGYGDVGVLLKLDDAKPAAEVVWRESQQRRLLRQQRRSWKTARSALRWRRGVDGRG
jgi:hypothetical protein